MLLKILVNTAHLGWERNWKSSGAHKIANHGGVIDRLFWCTLRKPQKRLPANAIQTLFTLPCLASGLPLWLISACKHVTQSESVKTRHNGARSITSNQSSPRSFHTKRVIWVKVLGYRHLKTPPCAYPQINAQLIQQSKFKSLPPFVETIIKGCYAACGVRALTMVT